MSLSVPPAPEFGEPLPPRPEPQVLAALARRKSAPALFLTAPGPSPAELADLLRLAARVPDHGKLHPWRFVILEGEAKAIYADRLQALAEKRDDAHKASAALGKLRNPPLAVAVVSSPHPEAPIPEWEQIMSAGAVCTMLLIAAGAMGYGATWITDWYAFDRTAMAMLGLADSERVAGYLYLGTPSETPQERVRPDVAEITTVWKP